MTIGADPRGVGVPRVPRLSERPEDCPGETGLDLRGAVRSKVPRRWWNTPGRGRPSARKAHMSKPNRARTVTCTDCGRERSLAARGRCSACYNRARRAGTDGAPAVDCARCGRTRPHYAQGLCNPCYQGSHVRGELSPVVTWAPPLGGPPDAYTFGSPHLPDRFWERVRQTSDGCWEWTGPVNRLNYGMIFALNQKWSTHRFAYEMLVGRIDPATELDHLCHTRHRSCDAGNSCLHRRCCNPAHLEPVTHEENMRRSRRPLCRSGRHELAGYNLIPSSDGKRRCRPCSNEMARKRKQRNRANALR